MKAKKAFYHMTVWGDGKELNSYFTEALTKEEARAKEEEEEQKWKRCYGNLYNEYSAYADFWEWA